MTQGDAIGVVVSDTLIDMYDHEGNITSIPLADISSFSLVRAFFVSIQYTRLHCVWARAQFASMPILL